MGSLIINSISKDSRLQEYKRKTIFYSPPYTRATFYYRNLNDNAHVCISIVSLESFLISHYTLTTVGYKKNTAEIYLPLS